MSRTLTAARLSHSRAVFAQRESLFDLMVAAGYDPKTPITGPLGPKTAPPTGTLATEVSDAVPTVFIEEMRRPQPHSLNSRSRLSKVGHGGVKWTSAALLTVTETVELPGELKVDEDHRSHQCPDSGTTADDSRKCR